MKKKKILMYLGILIIIIIVIVAGYYIYSKQNAKNNDNTILEEYTPEEELSDENLRQTIVTLYFLDIDKAELSPEARQIDSKELLENPYTVLVQLLIDGPENEKLTKLIPEGTTIKGTNFSGGVLTINFSEDFVKNQNLGKTQEELIINSIVNTVTELTEVEKVAIQIEGESNSGFPDGAVNFSNTFLREE